MPDQSSPPIGKERLVFGQGFLRDAWYFAALADDLKPGKLQRYEILGEPVLLARDTQGKAYAMRDICPHRAAPLSAGKMIPDPKTGQPVVQCPYHGWTFGTHGGCTAVPSLTADQPMDVERIRVRSYAVKEQQGIVWIYMTADARRPAEPDHEPPLLPGVVGGKPIIVEHGFRQSHRPRGGGADGPGARPLCSSAMVVALFQSSLKKARLLNHVSSALLWCATRRRKIRAPIVFWAVPRQPRSPSACPACAMSISRSGIGRFWASPCLTPVHATKTRITQVFWSDHAIFRAIAPIFKYGTRAFLKQDGDMVNLQNEGLRYDPSLLWIDDADTQAKWYQQIKKEWMVHRSEERPFANPLKPATLKWTS